MQVRDKIADCAALRSTRGRGELQWSLSVHPPRKRPDEDAGRTREPRIVRVNTRENGRSSTVEKQPDEGNGCPPQPLRKRQPDGREVCQGVRKVRVIFCL